ncbi:MAG: exodeoxyribonuclease VII large subunit [Candidatus Omnitrophica bacterium]|nr:exodeoxyribonuclease VII large subunit [Candidatus Omnitrophota bacterium]
MNGQLTQKQVFTVSQVTQDIKIILENTFPEIWVEGEVSNFSAQPSGHFYFSLKDASAVLDAAMFSRANRDLKFQIENGLKVVCFGKISNYGPRSKYNLIVEKIEPKGIGSLQLALEQLKQKLEKEGLFAPEHKRRIPYLPSRIGIVTSLQGAAIKDILKVVDRRFSDVEIIIDSVQVQGNTAKEEIAQAIRDLNIFSAALPKRDQIEVMIVGRGGGSIEDLWAFNEEIVARAIYNSKIPVISAVGHERDWTIADLVADLRAPTPSVAAELVVPEKSDLKEKLSELVKGMDLSLENVLRLCGNNLENVHKKLSLLNPAVLVEQYKERAQDLGRQIFMRTQHFLKLKETQVQAVIERLASLSPLGILSRGYSITFKVTDGQILKDAKTIKQGDKIKTKLHKGEITSQVTEVN